MKKMNKMILNFRISEWGNSGKWWLILVCISLHSSLFAQMNVAFTRENFPESRKGLKMALAAIEQGDRYYFGHENGYGMALPYYLQAYQFNGNNAELNFKIGECYLRHQEKFRALAFLERAAKLNPHMGMDLDWALGKAHQYALDFLTAETFYLKCKEAYLGNNQDTLHFIARKLEECRLGQGYLRKPANHKIENLGERLNTRYDEYVPLITADEFMFVFTTRRPHKKQRYLNELYLDYYEDIYAAYYRNGQWTMPERLSRPINIKGRNNASVHLTFDGQTIYSYRSKNNGDIYMSRLEGEKWSKPKPFREINDRDHQESHICLSYDGNTAYFVSDRPGGYGGKDIWYIERKEEGWGMPQNLGPVVNTPGDEESPFIHPDNKTMYFSSAGHPGMGGFDIFETEKTDSGWTKPRNLRYPINGPDDDLFFILSADGMNAYFSSARMGGFGGQDLYVIRPFNPDFPEETVPFKDFDVTLFVGLLKDNDTKKPVGGQVEIIDLATGKMVWSNAVNQATGKFTLTLPTGVNYGLAVESDGYLFYSENFNLEKQKGFREVQKVVYLKKVGEGASLVLNNVFFEFNKWDLKPESVNELERALALLQRYAQFRVVIEGHTDNVGSDEINERISQQRAESVRNYLVKRGLPAERIVMVQGYGKKKPLTTNDTPEGRATNRRVEIKLQR